MRKPLIAGGALALASLAAFGGSAFTGSGVTMAAPTSQFIGGTVSQSVTGATLQSVAYGFKAGDATHTILTSATLTFTDGAADGKVPTMALTGTSETATCTAVDTGTSTCTFSGDVTGLTGAAITVPSDS
jgi:hypothetical protein